MVVIGIISIMLAFVGPAVVGLTRSSGTKGAVSNVMNGLEQARSLAITSGSATYVVFADQTTAETHRCRAFIVFQDRADFTQVAVSKWNFLPTGVAFRPNKGLLTAQAPPSGAPPIQFLCPSIGNVALPYLKFEPTGMVVIPTDPNTLFVDIFSGFVDAGGQQTFTDKAQQTSGNYDAIAVARFTGRSRYVYPHSS